MERISFAKAKALGKKRYFSGTVCNNGHIASRYVSTNACVECNKTNLMTWRKKYPTRSGEYRDRWRRENPGKRQEQDRLRKYGLSSVEFNAMVQRQKGKCLICSKKTELVVDHCHNSGKVRGLLCSFCNRLLGVYETHKTSFSNYLLIYGVEK